MAGVTGARGSNRRRFLVCGGLALGIVVVLLAGFMAEASVKQVYWAVYSRLHPMRDSGDAHGFSTEETVYTQTFDGSDSRRSAAEKAIKSGEKEEVRLIKTQADKIHSKSDVRKAASEAKTRHSDTESAQEKEHVDNLADELSKKATAAFSAEIEAVAGSKEADRLIDNLQQDSAIEKTKLEKEAAEAAEKSSKGFWKRYLPSRKLVEIPEDTIFHVQKTQNSTLIITDSFTRTLKDSQAAGIIDRAARTRRRRTRHLDSNHTEESQANETSKQSGKSSKLAKLLADSDIALTRLIEHLKTTDEPHGISEEKIQLLKEVDAALDETVSGGEQENSDSQRTMGIESSGNKTIKGVFSGNVNDYQLTRQRIQKVAAEQNGIVIVTWANFKYLDFVQNWLAHMKEINVTTYMIGAMDKELLKALAEMGEENAFVMDSVLEAGDLSWGSPHFFAMGREKIQMIEHVTGMGVDVVVSDIDTVWLRDPFPYFAKYPQADILASTDLQHSTTNSTDMEKEFGICNIGILLFRKTAKGFAEEWNYNLAKDDNLWDQNGFNELVVRNLSGFGQRDDNLFSGYNGSTLIGILPVSAFANGHTYYSQDLSVMLNITPYVVHNTFQYSGTPGKRHRFRERLLWLADPKEYYDPEGGILSFDMHIDEYLEPTSHLNVENSTLEDFLPHFELIHHQLSQLRSAMAISSYLNRTLVLPRFWSGSDRWWNPFFGILPGSQNEKLPRYVPADHILDIDMMSREEQGSHLGPVVKFREDSFLNNSKLPITMLEDVLRVELCQEDDEECEDSLKKYNSSKKNKIEVRNGLSDQEITSIFQEFKNVKRLHFTDMRDVFGGFEKEANARKFEMRTRVYASLFCCVEGHPGHVWYDMWWEFKGHADRHGRKIDVWKPMLGP